MSRIANVEGFYGELIVYVLTYTNTEIYKKLCDDQRADLHEKMTIMVCKAFAPKRNFNITKTQVRYMVRRTLEEVTKEDAPIER